MHQVGKRWVGEIAMLSGAEITVLQAIVDLPKDPAGNVTDAQIAKATRITLDDVRNWLEILEGEGHASTTRTEDGLITSITAKGRLSLKQYRPFPTASAGSFPTHFGASALAASPSGTTSSPQDAPVQQTDASCALPQPPIRIFYSYSHKDEILRDELEEALTLMKRQGHLSGWHDRLIGAGVEWKGKVDQNLEEAQVILLLVSSSFLASDYCWDVETRRAMERHDQGEARVIPVILRSCDWHEAPFGKLMALPKDGKAVTSWRNRDEAWTDVSKGIRLAVKGG